MRERTVCARSQGDDVVSIGTVFVFWLVHDIVAAKLVLAWMIINTLPEAITATHDKLTGLYNRHFIVDQLERQLDFFVRYGARCSIVMFDINRFKQVSDQYGHTLGDNVLVAFSRRIESQIRLGDTFGRYGGEEFLLVLPMTDLPSALNLAERMRGNLADTPLAVHPLPLTITTSFGVAQLKANDSIDTWLVRADQALYRAKAHGRNCVMAD